MPSTTPTVDAIGKISLPGNTVPTSWYHELTTKEDKPHFLAISILSDIVYWYRPTEVRDESTGVVTGYKKKFAADKLQRNYDQLANQFHVSKEQARDACHYLRDKGLITIEIRHGVKYGDGMIANNVVYLEPCPEKIVGVSYKVSQMGVPKQAGGVSGVSTNTNSTTDSTTNNSTASNEAGEPLAHPALPENQPEGEVQNSFTNTELSPQKESAPAAPPPAARREIDPALLPETDDERYLFEQINIARVARHLKGQCRAFQTPQQRELFRENNAYFNGSTRRKIDMQLARGKFDVRSILNGLDYERRNPPRASQAFGKPQAATYDENNLPPIPPHVLAKQGKKIFKDGQWFSVPE